MAMKFMQSLDSSVFQYLDQIASKRGITVQELLRAVIVPEWIRIRDPGKENGNGPPARPSRDPFIRPRSGYATKYFGSSLRT